MAEPDKQYTGDGNDNYADAARRVTEAARQIGAASAQKAAASGANAAAGAAAGGPWGAVAAAAWALRHTLFKILITVCLCLLILIIMALSLPSVLFNTGLPAGPAAAPGGTVPAAIPEAYEGLSQAVTACVSGGYDYAKAEVERIITDGAYDYTLSKEAAVDNGQTSSGYDVCYILAAYSVSLEQRGTTKEDLVNKLNAVTSRMFPVTCEEKSSGETSPAEAGGGEAAAVNYIQCTIHPFDVSAIHTAFGIDADAPYGQFNIPTGKAIENMAAALKRTLYGAAAAGEIPVITDSELTAFLNRLTCSPARKELMRAALSLAGRVPYFWGGKSAAGWNGDWNIPRLVTSAGSASTGTLRPYGLDCSGFTDWVYKTALDKSLGAGGTWSQWENSRAISEAELLPGDLGFLDRPGAVPVNHVLLYAGPDASGGKLWVHCSGSAGGVVMNSPGYVKYYRRTSGIDLETVTVPGGTGGTFPAGESGLL